MCKENEYVQSHLPLCLPMTMVLQAQRRVSRQKAWRDRTLHLDLDLCLEMQSIAKLDIYVDKCMKLSMPNHLLDKFKAVRSPSLVPSKACPPKTYITSPTRTAA